MTEIHQSAKVVREATDRPTPNKAVLIGVAMLMIVLTNAVIFILPPLLSTIQAQYGLSTAAATTWLYTALTLGGGAGFILLPRLADLHGDRNTSAAAAALLAVGALIPAIGDSYPTLLAGCALMGFGGAAQLLPLGFLRRNLGEDGITVGVAVLFIGTGVGILTGMVGGGFLVETLSLRWFFVILTAVCVVTTVACYVAIPHAPPAERGGQIAVLGTMWMIAWVAAILLTLTQGLIWGAAALIPLVAGIIGGIAWVRSERRSNAAVFDVALMKAPRVVASCLCIALFAAVNSAFLLLLSAYAQVVPDSLRPDDAYGLGLSALQTGLLMTPFAAAFLIRGTVLDRALLNGRDVPVFAIGALISASGLAWLALAHDQQWQYVVGAAVVGLGTRIGYTAGFTMVQMAVPEEKAGMAAGIAGTFMAVGFAVGTALISADLSASLVPVAGTDIEVAAEGLYSIGYALSGVLALLAVVTVLASHARSEWRVRRVGS